MIIFSTNKQVFFKILFTSQDQNKKHEDFLNIKVEVKVYLPFTLLVS